MQADVICVHVCVCVCVCVYIYIYIYIYIFIWYIFDIGIILISLRTNEFFSLCDVGSTCLTLVTCWQQLGELTVNFIHVAASVSDLQFFIFYLRAGECCW